MQLSLFWLSFSFFGVNVRSRSHSNYSSKGGRWRTTEDPFFPDGKRGSKRGSMPSTSTHNVVNDHLGRGYERRAFYFISALHIKQATLALVFSDANFLYLELKKSEYINSLFLSTSKISSASCNHSIRQNITLSIQDI